MEMYKLLISVACFLLVLCSCTEKRKTSYFWVRYEDRDKPDTNRIERIDTLHKSNTVHLSYLTQWDTISYHLKLSQPTGSTIDWWTGKSSLAWHSDTMVVIGNKPYSVTRYLLEEEGMGASTLHYWTPEMGVFVFHSKTWPSVSVLQSSDTVLNSNIKKLVRATVPERLIRGKLLMELRYLRNNFKHDGERYLRSLSE